MWRACCVRSGSLNQDRVEGMAFQAILAAGAGGEAFQKAVDPVQEARPDLGVVVAQGSFQDDSIGQDIKTAAAGDGAEGEDGGRAGVFALGKDGLEQSNGLGRQRDGVDAVVGSGGVSLPAADFQAELIGAGHDNAGAVARSDRRCSLGATCRPTMAAYLSQDAELDHEFGAAQRARQADLLRRVGE